MINPAFHHNNLQDMIELMVMETDNRITNWITQITTTTSDNNSCVQLDLHRELSAMTLAVISRCAFGSSATADTTVIYEAFDDILKWTHWRAVRLIEFIPIIRNWKILHKPDLINCKNKIITLAERLIRDRKEGKSGKENGGRHDLLDQLLEAVDPTSGERLTDVEVRDEAMTFVLAGHETTANLMSWMLHVCMVRPQLWQQLVAEVDTVCGSGDSGDETPSYSQLMALPILDAVINETLRLFPPIPIMQREVTKAHILGAHTTRPVHMPVGARIAIELIPLHRLQQYWGATADVFDHTRWLQVGKRPYSHPYAYLAFSSGVRNCIGMNFALLEARVIMVRVLQRVRMEWVEGQKMGPDGWPVQQPIVDAAAQVWDAGEDLPEAEE